MTDHLAPRNVLTFFSKTDRFLLYKSLTKSSSCIGNQCLLTDIRTQAGIVPLYSLCTISTGRKRRLGFGKRGKNSFTVQRSEEVGPGELRGVSGVSRASSASSENEDDRLDPPPRRATAVNTDTIVRGR